MRLSFITLLALSLNVFVTTAQEKQTSENPFDKLGYDPLVATSSRGEFAEFHDQVDIVEIGSVLFNTKTNEVVKLLREGETTIDLSSATAAMSIDPHCERYYWISPYVYCANNPLKFIDPDGMDYWIYYVDDNGDEQHWVFTGDNQKDAPKNSFVNNFLLAYDYNITNDGGEAMKDAAFDRNVQIGVQFEDRGGTSGYDSERGMQMIGWDPYEGTREDDGNGFSISPATTLDHETDHSLNQIRNPKQHKEDSKRWSDNTYNTLEERRVITGSEMRTANANGEIPSGQMRGTHYGKSVRVATPISNTSAPLKTLSIMARYLYKKVTK